MSDIKKVYPQILTQMFKTKTFSIDFPSITDATTKTITYSFVENGESTIPAGYIPYIIANYKLINGMAYCCLIRAEITNTNNQYQLKLSVYQPRAQLTTGTGAVVVKIVFIKQEFYNGEEA